MTLIRYLANLGYGTRRDVTALVRARRVTDDSGATLSDTAPWSHAAVRIDGAPLDPPPGAVLMLHKPTGYVCSTRDLPPLIYDLLPPRFLRRSPVMSAVGRLDRDTSGLLLLTDDGALNHRLTSPKHHVSKTYTATLADDLHGNEVVAFASGTLMLNGETAPLAPAQLHVISNRVAALTLTEGRYHQVRRMFAAMGNHVIALQRTSVGAVTLDDLPRGAWRELTRHERALLTPSALPTTP
jgi:16S rRNA pseudouridine516 synthase